MDAMRQDGVEPGPRGATLRLIVPPQPEYARYVRKRVAAFTAANAVPDSDADDFLTALGEALANAIEHAGSERKIEATCWIVADDRLIATIVDAGVGFRPSERTATTLEVDANAERGRGIAIMRRCTDQCAIRSVPGQGTAVILTRYIRHRRLTLVPDQPTRG